MDNTFLIYATDVLGETKSGLSGSEITKYCTSYSIEFNVPIPHAQYPFEAFASEVPNKRTALLRNIKQFNDAQQFLIVKELCELPRFKDSENVKELKRRLYERYGHLATEKISNTELVQKTKHWLDNHPKALEQYEYALLKYEGGIYQRNTLDDIRLSFEFLVKDLLQNKKSLENQISELGQRLSSVGISVELRNMVTQIIKYYTDFQNHHVKHDDAINENEIEYVIELTSVIMKFLIKNLYE